MKITFASVEFRNFLSYGNGVTELNLNHQGLIQISGKNGVGKSAMFDALSFCLFGKPYRKVKKSELINRENEKDLWTRVTFYKNTAKYQITRTITPNTIKIEKLNDISHKFEELELLSSVKLIQDEIDKIIGINYDTFRHIVFIAPSANQIKPFLTMSKWEKRTLIESLFNLEIISDMLYKVKQDKTEVKHKMTTANSNKNLLTGITKQSLIQYNNSKTVIENFDKDKLVSIKTYEDKLNIYKSEEESQIKTLKELKHIIKNDLKDKLKSKLENNDKEIGVIRGVIGGLQHESKTGKKIIKELNSNDICPACNTTITEEHKVMELDRFTKLIDLNKTLIKEKEDELGIILEKNVVINKNIDTLNEAMHRIKSSVKIINTLKTNIEDVTKDIENKNNEVLELDIKSIEKTLTDNKDKLQSLYDDIEDYTKQESMFEVASFLLSDSGIKTEFYHSIVPLFNKTINSYVTKFELPISIVFDYEFNVTIRSITSGDDDLNYFSFSEGEKKRIEISILLSFIKLSKTVANWSTNILGLDETLDSGIDSEGLNIMLDSIKDISTEEQLNVMIITHKVISSDIFDMKLLVTKDSFFSKILYI